MRSVHASVAEMPVGQRVELVASEQCLELAQVPRQLAVAGPRRPPTPASAAAPAGVRLPSPAPSSRIRATARRRPGVGDDSGVQAAPAAAISRSPGRDSLRHVSLPPVSANSQPATARQARARPRAPARAERPPPSRASRPSRASGRCGSSAGTASAADGHVGVAEHDERDRLQAPAPAATVARGDHAERALDPTRNRATSKPLLRQQVFERVARNLPAEPSELGADHPEPITHQAVERREHRHFGCSPAGRPSRP